MSSIKRRVPVRLQLTSSECGAACLAMVLSYYGRSTSVGDVRTLLPESRDGLRASTLLDAGETVGLAGRGLRVSDLGSLQQVELPVIAHWNTDHFVVLEAWDGKVARVVDPAVGRVRYGSEELEESFGGVVLQLEPSEQFESRTRQFGSDWVRYLKSTIDPTAGRLLIGALAATTAIRVVLAIVPLLIGTAIDRLSTNEPNLVALILIGGILVAAFAAVLSWLRGLLLLHLRVRMDEASMRRFLTHMLRLPYEWFQNRRTGDLILRLSATRALRSIASDQLVGVVLDSVFLVVYVIAMATRSLTLAATVVALAAIQVSVMAVMAGPLGRTQRRSLLDDSTQQSLVVQLITGVASIKAMGAVAPVLQRWEPLLKRSLKSNQSYDRALLRWETAQAGLSTLTLPVLFGVGVAGVVRDQFSVGEMVGLVTLAQLALQPLQALMSSWEMLVTASAQLDRVNDVLDAPIEASRSSSSATSQVPSNGRNNATGAEIEFDAVSYVYGSNETPSIDNVSFRIDAGSMVAFVGPTGSGKSTLLSLMTGLLPTSQGTISIDGQPIAGGSSGGQYPSMGVVLQEPFILSGRVRDNLTLVHSEASDEDLWHVLDQAGLSDEIADMPFGLDTFLGEQGSGLSGGQRQRLALARSLLGHPRVLVLDEATSSLDASTEDSIGQHISVLPATRVVVAHRLSTIWRADRIFVLDGGKLVEQGSHGELLELSGVYAELVRLQMFGAE